MPELPEVETTRRGLQPHVVGQCVRVVAVRDFRLRWPVPATLESELPGQTVSGIDRRAKYLLFGFSRGRLLVHLGMSGSLRFHPGDAPVAGRHDHLDLVFAGGGRLRYTDPRRFGCVLWLPEEESHPLLEGLGPEPLGPGFTTAYLQACCNGRKASIKSLVMNARIVVGVGNIYANEALFMAGIAPDRAAGTLGRVRLQRLVVAIREVLAAAIAAGGTTLRDFVGGDGRPGYFEQTLSVYGRAGEPCVRCGSPVRLSRQGNRATYHCGRCQR